MLKLPNCSFCFCWQLHSWAQDDRRPY